MVSVMISTFQLCPLSCFLVS